MIVFSNRTALLGTLSWMILLSLLAACESEKAPPPPEPVVATVNGESISQGEFEKALATELGLVKREAPLDTDEMNRLKEAVLDNLVRERLMLQRARELSLTVPEEKVNARIEEIRKDYNHNRFDEMFKSGQVDFLEWKNALRERILLENLVAREVNEKILVTDREARTHFNANRRAYLTKRRAHIAQIVLPDRERAEAVLKRLKAGEDFGKVARQVSISPEAARGGDLGFFERGVMPEAIDREVSSLSVGKLSQVVQSPYGFHIFKVLEREKSGGRKFSDVKERVIVELRKQKESEAYKGWIDELKSKAAIRIIRPLPGPRGADRTETQ
jgi:parvulin-like peptidyl-prolyl isomerase